MSIIVKIKEKIGSIILKNKRNNSRKRGVYNFETAKTVGIILNANSQFTFETARDFVKYIQSFKIEVLSLGFVDSVEVLNFYSRQIGMDYFSKKNLNWYGKPKNPKVQEFIQKDFDILIDLSLNDYFPIQYITASSNAKFKIGRFKNESACYDLMIDISENKKLDFYIEQIKHYLSILKTNNND
ncbi:MAG: hypothetical protein JXR58_12505 [Bacteroidales bacterium]|nr:hypothetical protein [Bacteroidales bacterium]